MGLPRRLTAYVVRQMTTKAEVLVPDSERLCSVARTFTVASRQPLASQHGTFLMAIGRQFAIKYT